MSKARIMQLMHDDFGVTLSEAKKAYNIALEYIRLRSAIGDHPEDYEPSEYILVKASSQPEYTEQDVRDAFNDGYRCGMESAQPEQIARDIATIIENEKDMRVILKNTEPEPAIPLSWIESYIEWLNSLDNGFSTLEALQIGLMVRKWKDEQDESNRRR